MCLLDLEKLQLYLQFPFIFLAEVVHTEMKLHIRISRSSNVLGLIDQLLGVISVSQTSRCKKFRCEDFIRSYVPL